jgi:hypothetical protein
MVIMVLIEITKLSIKTMNSACFDSFLLYNAFLPFLCGAKSRNQRLDEVRLC